MKNAIRLAAICLAVGVYSQSGALWAQDDTPTTTNAPTPLLTPPLVTLGTNWLARTFDSICIAGVYTTTWEGKSVDRGGIAVEYVLWDGNVKDWFRLRSGLAIVTPSTFEAVYAGPATTINIIPGGSLELWLRRAPVLDLLGQTISYSKWYGFAQVGSQVDKLNLQASVGFGIVCW